MKGKSSKPGGPHDPFVRFATHMMETYVSDFRPEKSSPPLVNGYDLIEKLGLSPSPKFKKILQSVEEARLAKIISCKSEALQYIKDLWLPPA